MPAAAAEIEKGMRGGFSNLLLQQLPLKDAEYFRSNCSRQRFQTGEIIGSRGNSPICFPQTAILSISDTEGLEIGLIGPEGMTGWTVALSGVHHPLPGHVVMGGTALTLTAEQLAHVCAFSVRIRRAVMRFSVTMTAQMASTIISARGRVQVRLARRLLMIHDRFGSDHLPLSHDRLARSLGLRRASVTDCLHLLEGEMIVRGRRNSIEIRDRAALERIAGAAYGPAERSYRSLIGPFGKCGAPVAAPA